MTWIIAGIYGFGFIIFLILLLYIIVKRIEDRKKEKFEKRNN
jgi:uncharacterized membrane protein